MLKNLLRRSGTMPGTIRNYGWSLAAIPLVIAALSLLFSLPPHSNTAYAAPLPDASTSDETVVWSMYGIGSNLNANAQIFNDDLVVATDQTLTGDIVVYSGDATVEKGGAIDGNLIVYSGNIDIARGGMVTGDVTAFSGNVEVDGRVEGDLASASGDIALGESALIGGDVSVLSGDIKQEMGASVGGSVVRGPNFEFTLPNGVSPMHGAFGPLFRERFGPGPSEDVNTELGRGGPTWGERLGWFILSLIVAGVVTVGVTLLCGLLMVVWPAYVGPLDETVQRQLPLSFAVGLLTNLSLLFLIVFLTVLLCTAPLAFALALGALGVNLVGWTALGSIVGRRVTRYAGVSVRAAATAAIGALVLTAPLALVFALGGYLRFFALLALLLLSSAGAGAVVMDLLPRISNRNRPPATPTQPDLASSPSGETAPDPGTPTL